MKALRLSEYSFVMLSQALIAEQMVFTKVQSCHLGNVPKQTATGPERPKIRPRWGCGQASRAESHQQVAECFGALPPCGLP